VIVMPRSISRRRLLGAAASLAVTGAAAVEARAATRISRRPVLDPSHFVLVHGAWHGSWCWYKVIAALEGVGHRVTAVELPSGGIDSTLAPTVTLEAQADRVIALLDTLTAPVVLVGHSAGGPVISTVAEARPDKIAKLVYLTAYLLPTGSSILSAVVGDPESLVSGNLIFGSDGISVRLDGVRDLFYGMSDDADVALARLLLKPMGIMPLNGKVAVGAAFESVRRFYIACRRDHAITHWFQQTMYAALPCEKVYTINSDHSPFFSRPTALVRVLRAIARG
jgi:pimeloyl-ACP methyl ester carboxylesterase